MELGGELNYGQIGRTVFMHDGKVSQVVENEVKNLMPASETNIELAVEELRLALMEAMAAGHLQVGVQVDFNKNKGIKLIRVNKSRRVGIHAAVV